MVILARKDLRGYRIRAGFSVEGLAREAGVNQATISYIENRKRNPSPATAKKICDVLQQPFDVLFELKEE
ncbi:MAG: HTH-type transcriptional regulator, competence development regulator [Thermoanaerobacteraceae bacterium]|nr:HTH-type transcriptional regulator, competence development regulator [Thermoanaerobacteraceae bacterium]